MAKLEKRFRLSYAGECEYYVGHDLFTCRYFGNPGMAYNTGVWETDIVPSIGTVRYDSSAKWGQFPPAEVMELFPGFVGCRIIFHETEQSRLPIGDPGHDWPRIEYQYDGPAPELCPDPVIPGYLTFRHEAEERAREEREYQALRTAAESSAVP